MKNQECENYTGGFDCLGVAARNQDNNFDCEGCDGKTIYKPKPKRGRSRKGEYRFQQRIYIDFKYYPELHQKIVEEAKKELRTLPKQIVYLCKKQMDVK